MVTPASLHQPLPNLDSPIANLDLTPAFPWYQLLVALWQRSGGSVLPQTQAVYLTTDPQGAIAAWQALSNDLLGTIVTSASKGGPAEPQTLTGSPFVFTAPIMGMFGVYGGVMRPSGRLEISRDDGTTWQVLSQVGGTLWLLNGDKIRISWVGGTPPEAVWYPIGQS